MKSTNHVALEIEKRAKLLGCIAALTGAGFLGIQVVQAMPQGGVIVGGSGTISATGNSMTVAQQTQNLFVNWDGFSIGKGEKVQFTGPQNFAVLNRVVGHDESKIYGEINAANHGNVYLINPNGILIGDGAVINTGSFIASTKDVIDVPSFINSGTVNFQGDAQGNIINLGAVKADRIEMHGDTISLKAANVDTNFNAPNITIDANAIHAGTPENEDGDVDQKLINSVNTKLGVTAEGFLLKDSMGALREAVEDNSQGHYMLSQDDLTNETWEGYAPNLNWGAAIDGLGYTVGNKNIVVGDGTDGTGIFGYISGDVRVDNFTFDHIQVNDTKKNSTGTGTLAGYLDGDGVRVANITVSNGSVTGYNNVGGLIGWSDGFREGNTFLNVHNVNTSVTGQTVDTGFVVNGENQYTGQGVGGIIGYENSWKNQEGKTNTFRNVSNSGHITGRIYVGGLAGRLAAANMDQVRNTGRIEQQTVKFINKYGYSDQVKSYFIGGIAGAIGPEGEAAKGVRISHAYNGGTIGVDTSKDGYYDRGWYIGGIVGTLSGHYEGADWKSTHTYGAQGSIIDYAHNTGTITAGFENVGGIVGFTTGLGKENEGKASDVIIRHSYNDGNIMGDYSGGIAGKFGGTIEQSYNNGALGQYSGGLVAVTDNELYNDVVIRDSYNKKNGTAHVGGIIGVDYTEGTTLLERVWNEADIPVATCYSGGIIGDAQNCGSITMNQVYNFGNVLGDEYSIAGMIGHNQVNTDATITFNNCVNYGNVSNGGSDEIGGFIGSSTPDGGKNDIYFNNCANFGTIAGTDEVGGFIGYHQLRSGKTGEEIFFNNSYNYGKVTADEQVGGFIGELYYGDEISSENPPHFTNSGTIGDKAIGEVYDGSDGFKGNFGAQTGITEVPDQTAYANAQFLTWKNTTTVDNEGQLGTETGSYPDGGYTWKLYETGRKDSNGNKLFYKPELTAFQTKVETRKNSVENKASDVSGALYDVTMPDGQQIKGVDWKRVLELQDQFTRVQNRGDGTQQAAYTASNKESGGSVPDQLYGFYNSSQQGLNIFITPGTVKPEEQLQPEPPAPDKPEPPTPDKPVLPSHEISRNDYLYSDEHDTGDGKLNWYMHMPPVIYIEDSGVQMGKMLETK